LLSSLLADISSLFHETRELVDDGHMTESDYRDLVFRQPARLWAGCPGSADFFDGTFVERAVREELGFSESVGAIKQGDGS